MGVVAQGEEFSFEVFDDEIIGFTKKYMFELPYFAEMGHLFPANISQELKTSVSRQLTNIMQGLGLRHGAYHVEGVVDSHGTLRLIEVNARLGGGYIPVLLKTTCGIDLIDRYMAFVTNTPAAQTESHGEQGRRKVASIRFNPTREQVECIRLNGQLKLIDFIIPDSAALSKSERSNLDRKGYAIVSCDHYAPLEQLYQV